MLAIDISLFNNDLNPIDLEERVFEHRSRQVALFRIECAFRGGVDRMTDAKEEAPSEPSEESVYTLEVLGKIAQYFTRRRKKTRKVSCLVEEGASTTYDVVVEHANFNRLDSGRFEFKGYRANDGAPLSMEGVAIDFRTARHSRNGLLVTIGDLRILLPQNLAVKVA